MSIQSRQRANSIFVYLVFGILIAVFIISFGPQSVATGQGCGGTQQVGRVHGKDLSMNDWRFAWGLTDGQGRARSAMANLVRRELLADLADERGYRVNDAAADASIAAGQLYFGGALVSGQVALVESAGGKHFSYDALTRIAENFGGIGNYRSQQKRELLAHIADAELQFGLVATDEARALYTAQNSYVNLDYVRFRAADYGAALSLTEADLARFMATHEARVKEAYEARKASFTATPAMKKIRELRVAKGGDAAASKAQIDAARASVVAKQKTFAQVAAALAIDAAAKAKAGDLGWREVASPLLATDALNSAVATLSPGEVSDVVEDAEAYYVIAIEGARNGDLSFEQVKGELAEEIARQVWGQEAARKAAIEAATAIAGGKAIDALFAKKEPSIGRTELDLGLTLAQSATVLTPADQPTPAAVPAADPMRPVTETLPTLHTPVVPVLDSQVMIKRSGKGLEGFGASQALARAAFADLTPGTAAAKVFAADDDFVVVRLIGRSTVEESALAANVETLASSIADERGRQQASALLRERCEQATAARDITVNNQMLQDDTTATLPPFSPCDYF